MSNKPVIIGIAGGSGSGKSLLANKIRDHLGSCNAIIIRHDRYYKDRSEFAFSERESINYDSPDALDNDLLIAHIIELIAGRCIESPDYDFSTHCRKPGCTEIQPCRVILIEGILIFAVEKLRDLMDIRIFIDVDNDIRFIRRLQRDVKERGRCHDSVIEQYLQTAKPMYEKYVEPCKQFADMIVHDACSVLTMEKIVHEIGILQQ